jgi:hypothetical protein
MKTFTIGHSNHAIETFIEPYYPQQSYTCFIDEAINFYNEELNDIENNQQELRNFDQSKHEILTQIENKRQERKQEIKQLVK